MVRSKSIPVEFDRPAFAIKLGEVHSYMGGYLYRAESYFQMEYGYSSTRYVLFRRLGWWERLVWGTIYRSQVVRRDE